jgi:aminotransferase
MTILDKKNLPKFVAPHVQDLPRSGIRAFFDIVQTMPDVISLGIGEPDFVTPLSIRQAAIESLQKGKTAYTSNSGTLELRKEIVKYVKQKFGVEYDPATEIIVTVGVSEALDIALRTVISPGEEVIYHEPCYVSYVPTILLAHGKPVPISTHIHDLFALKAERIRTFINPQTKALLLNFPTNPTGASLPREEQKKIADIAQEHNLLVLTDEIYSELTYKDQCESIVSLPGMKERTILLHGFSKAFAMTGFRIGYACAPASIIEGMLKLHQYAIMCAPTMSQEAALEALRNGEKETQAMKKEYQERRNYMVAALNRIGLPCHEPCGAFYVFPSIQHTGLTSQEFALQLLEKGRVATIAGTAFGPSGEGYIRCSYATSMENLKKAVERIENFLQNL